MKVTGRFVGNVLARLGWLCRFAISDDLEGGKELLDLNCYKSRLLLLYPNKQESLLNHKHKSKNKIVSKTFEGHTQLNSAGVTLSRHRQWLLQVKTSGISILLEALTWRRTLRGS